MPRSTNAKRESDLSLAIGRLPFRGLLYGPTEPDEVFTSVSCRRQRYGGLGPGEMDHAGYSLSTNVGPFLETVIFLQKYAAALFSPVAVTELLQHIAHPSAA